jgi:hypothetical protein
VGDFPDQHETWRTRLIAVSAQIDPSIAAKILAEALVRETDAGARSTLASALSKVTGRMEPAEAAQVCSDVIRIILQEQSAKPQDRDTRNAIHGIVAMLLPRLDRRAAHLCARELSMLMFPEAYVNNADPTVRNRGMMGGYGSMMGGGYWKNLSPNTILEEASPEQIARRSPITAIGIVQGSGGYLCCQQSPRSLSPPSPSPAASPRKNWSTC